MIAKFVGEYTGFFEQEKQYEVYQSGDEFFAKDEFGKHHSLGDFPILKDEWFLSNFEVIEKPNTDFDYTLASGHTVELLNHEGTLTISLINSNGYCVSDAKLHKNDVRKLKLLLSEFED